uniref:Uncharacterized protein n=1 Tax=Arundo donax TaxID=35708 RepID=A0A0A9HB77_ARUDO
MTLPLNFCANWGYIYMVQALEIIPLCLGLTVVMVNF